MQIQGKNYYQLLRVSRAATSEEIKSAYRQIARVYHPDSNFYSEIIDDRLMDEAMEIFKAITAAYNTLIDEGRRSSYDASLPPELRGWDEKYKDEESLDARTNWDSPFEVQDRHSMRKRKPTGSFGRDALRIFETERQSSFDTPFGEDIQPVSSMIPRRGLWFRIRRYFGF